MTDTTLAVARKAFDLFAQGWLNDDFNPYIDLLADEMTFWFPVGKHRGKFSGVEGQQQMIAKCRDHEAAGDRLTLHEPDHILANSKSVIFEFEADGLYGGNPIRATMRSPLKFKTAK